MRGGPVFRAVVGTLAGLLARAWMSTWRVRVVVHPALAAAEGAPWVLAFWHGEQFGLLAWPRRRHTVALVSLSRDGDLQARALARLGLAVERGSTSRGGARGLVAIVRRLRGGLDAAFAVDGPRGPLHSVAPGARLAARAAHAVLVPAASAGARVHVLARTWDAYALPLPFTRVVVALGPPIDPAVGDAEALGRAISEASALARQAAGVVR